MWRRYPLTIGLPQTNHRNLSEARLLMEAGNFFWWALGEAIGQPISRLRAASGQPVYAPIYFIEERFPSNRSLATFRLDERLRFAVETRSVSKFAIEARVVFDTEDRLDPAALPEDGWWSCEAPPHPVLRFGSVFASVDPSSGQLKLAAPVNADLAALSPCASDEGASPIARHAKETGQLGVIPDDWPSLGPPEGVEVAYLIDKDRDTNATGLVYFANYVSFCELGERAMLDRLGSAALGADERRLRWRRMAYYEHAGPSDRLLIRVSAFGSSGAGRATGLRFRIIRASDQALLCLSEALMTLAPETVEPQLANCGENQRRSD